VELEMMAYRLTFKALQKKKHLIQAMQKTNLVEASLLFKQF